MLRAGKLDQKIRPGRILLIDVGLKDEDEAAIFIDAATVPSFFTPEFWEAYEFYAATETLEAPPFSGGWTTWPNAAVQVLLILKAERNRCDREEIKKRTGGHDD